MKNMYSIENDTIHIGMILKCIYDNKNKLASFTFVISLLSILYVYNLPNIYQSDVTLAPSIEDNNAKLGSGLGNIAALAGVNIGNSKVDKVGIAIETMKSRSFIIDFIATNDLYVELCAAQKAKGEELVIDEELYDVKLGKWLNDKNGKSKKPSDLEAYNEFKKIFFVEQEKSTGMIKVSIKHVSATHAKKWIDLIVMTINNKIRDQDVEYSKRNINFLENKLKETLNSEMREVIYSLIQEQMKTVMLANARDEYVFRIIDRAVVAEEHIKPARFAIVLFITIVSLFVSTIYVLLKNMKKYRGLNERKE